MRSMRRFRLALFGAAVVCAVASAAYAGTLVRDFTGPGHPSSTCTVANCSSALIPGNIHSASGNAGYWEMGLFATAGSCLRVDLFQQSHDLALVVRAPNGTVYRNDDSFRPGCSLCPRVVISPTPVAGWYSASLGHFFTTAVDATFLMQWGNYPAGNVNCSPATTPLSPGELEPEKPDDGGVVSPSEPDQP